MIVCWSFWINLWIDFERIELLSSFRYSIAWFWGSLIVLYLFNFELIWSIILIQMQLKSEWIQIGVELYSIPSSNSIHSVETQTSVSIRFIESKQMNFNGTQTRDCYLLCKEISSLIDGSIVQNLSWNRSFVDSLIDQSDRIQRRWQRLARQGQVAPRCAAWGQTASSPRRQA